MRNLYHFQLCPFCRKLRILLAEKRLEFRLVEEKFWERRQAFAALNPAMQVPVLAEPDGFNLADSYAIVEFLESRYDDTCFFGKSLNESAEIRRLISWFDQKFFHEVSRYLIDEKILRYLTDNSQPCSEALRAANNNVKTHLKYIEFLTRKHKWLAGEELTVADMAAAAHISVVDYLGDISWEYYPLAKEWYTFIKSRPTFRPLLEDAIQGFTPPKHYRDLDF